MPIDPVSAAIGIGGSVLSGIFGGSAAKRAKRKAQKEAQRLKGKLEFLENNRQAIINPYEGATDLSSMATDYSSQFSNPYANLSVATQAAEMKIEQTDIALANTLDTLAQTGGGAGGATALAQAAAASKKEVAASIEQQEAANEKMRAEGEARLEDKIIAEKQRIEGIEMSQAERMQNLDAQGQLFQFQQKENREQQKIDRTAAELDNARMMAAQAQADQTSAFTGMLGGITDTLSSAFTPKS
tara:strand:+ start:255 stop:983 length:729 start_codon:yes stop_codon:yes gene_type:complete